MIRHSFIEADRLKKYGDNCLKYQQISEKLKDFNCSGIVCFDKKCNIDTLEKYYQVTYYCPPAGDPKISFRNVSNTGRSRSSSMGFWRVEMKLPTFSPPADWFSSTRRRSRKLGQNIDCYYQPSCYHWCASPPAMRNTEWKSSPMICRTPAKIQLPKRRNHVLSQFVPSVMKSYRKRFLTLLFDDHSN